MVDVRIGCSGYYYQHWRGLWYPPDLPASRWFAFYAEHFDTLEINATFYRFPTAAVIACWQKQAPSGFLYSVKVPRLITHYKRFSSCRTQLDDLYKTLSALGAHLGCILFQLPPSLQYSPEMLDKILATMRPGFRNTLEFRHSTWWREDVFAALLEQHIAFCSVSAPGLPNDLVVTAPEAYLRLHGDPWYSQDYDEVALDDWAKRIRKANAERVWVYFNNDARALAPRNAEALKRMLSA